MDGHSSIFTCKLLLACWRSPIELDGMITCWFISSWSVPQLDYGWAVILFIHLWFYTSQVFTVRALDAPWCKDSTAEVTVSFRNKLDSEPGRRSHSPSSRTSKWGRVFQLNYFLHDIQSGLLALGKLPRERHPQTNQLYCIQTSTLNSQSRHFWNTYLVFIPWTCKYSTDLHTTVYIPTQIEFLPTRLPRLKLCIENSHVGLFLSGSPPVSWCEALAIFTRFPSTVHKSQSSIPFIQLTYSHYTKA